MRENALYQKINDLLDPHIHHQSMTGTIFSGTPDHYYDGVRRDLWVEYKRIDAMPRSGYVVVAPKPGLKKQPRGRLTALQQAWLLRRCKNGGNAWVIVGLPNKTAVVFTDKRNYPNALQKLFEDGVSVFAGRPIAIVANAIERFVNEGVEWKLE